jgi:hypothetical protein
MRMSQLRKEHPRQKKQQVSATTQGWEGPGISEKNQVKLEMLRGKMA